MDNSTVVCSQGKVIQWWTHVSSVSSNANGQQLLVSIIEDFAEWENTRKIGLCELVMSGFRIKYKEMSMCAMLMYVMSLKGFCAESVLRLRE